MLEREEIIKIYDIYKELLTEKQQEYFENYYFEDLSLSEIAENMKVSKSFVGKTINKIEKKLEHYESLLSIYNKNKIIEKLIKTTNDSNTKKELENLI